MRIIYIFVISCLLLSGCIKGPIQRADDILFSVPYITFEHKEGDILIGAKRLSGPEIEELFCNSEELQYSYQVLYLRVKNKGPAVYVCHPKNVQAPSKDDISEFFNPQNGGAQFARFITTLSVGAVLLPIATSAALFFAAAIGSGIVVNIFFDTVLGVKEYQRMGKKVLVAPSARGHIPALTVGPYQEEHYFFFAYRNDPNASRLVLSVGSSGKVMKDITFDFAAAETV